MSWNSDALLGGINWANYNNPAQGAPAYGPPMQQQRPTQFRDTFKEGDDQKRRKRLAELLQMRAQQ